MTDHQDPVFISDRMRQLGLYITELVQVPHVPDMTCLKSFLGMMNQVREISFLFPSENLGISFTPLVRQGGLYKNCKYRIKIIFLTSTMIIH